MDILHLACLFDKSGIMGRDWADAGHKVTCVDWEAIEGIRDGIHYIVMDLHNREAMFKYFDESPPDCVISFPDCTHLAICGNGSAEKKKIENPNYLDEAIFLFETGEILAERYGVPSFTENPISRAATLYRKPEAYFHPYEYGGYLPEDDIHPIWPEYIKPRDAYPKKTSAWLLNGFELPPKKPVKVRPGYSDQHKKLGGKSQKTKDIRSITPRGFSKAVFLHMSKILMRKKYA